MKPKTKAQLLEEIEALKTEIESLKAEVQSLKKEMNPFPLYEGNKYRGNW
jgi:archaellum component FlaC